MRFLRRSHVGNPWPGELSTSVLWGFLGLRTHKSRLGVVELAQELNENRLEKAEAKRWRAHHPVHRCFHIYFCPNKRLRAFGALPRPKNQDGRGGHQ